MLCYGLYGARFECRKIQRVSAAYRGPRAGRPAGGGGSLRPDGLWAACHHGTDPGGDAALLPGRRLRGVQRRAVRLPVRKRDLKAPGL